MEEICDTPAEEAWQTVGGKGADFWNQLECYFKKKP
jgi:hypothetical protein